MQINPPCRVYPGRLSVSRSIGDIYAKNESMGGNPNVIISKPDVNWLKISQDHDFIVLGCIIFKYIHKKYIFFLQVVVYLIELAVKIWHR